MAPQTVATAQKRKNPDKETETSSSSSTSSAAALCANGCGFYGTAANKGMCSKCYRERHPPDADAAAGCRQETEPDLPASVFAVPPPQQKKIRLSVPAVASSADAAAAAAVADTSSSSSPATNPQKQEDSAAKPATATANRCATCRKKVGLTGFRCRCGGTFCGSHRHAGAHACGFDYKAAGREQIAKQNPLVVAAKIAKI